MVIAQSDFIRGESSIEKRLSVIIRVKNKGGYDALPYNY